MSDKVWDDITYPFSNLNSANLNGADLRTMRAASFDILSKDYVQSDMYFSHSDTISNIWKNK